ncbi:hypothetical protein [Dyella caseinilytica]|uniref:Uncharacterized protein n=1 Tax=Dyella caseinilytica TaxID=1849581 RepID=A0ABX7GPQ5_9GAMM|nr:hypothetical protein [Dyella caseinilytica]QRN52414.1 hypothetical protein ISN74_13105 [Dyella caseinilytica]GGA05777.1 hypothetical protein GCM10011408_28400 [Dyella caseinilytica]
MHPQYKPAPMAAQRSLNVSDYQLSKEHREIFAKHENVVKHMRALTSGKLPTVVYVTRSQWMAINDTVSRQSHGRLSLETVRYNGLPIKHP